MKALCHSNWGVDTDEGVNLGSAVHRNGSANRVESGDRAQSRTHWEPCYEDLARLVATVQRGPRISRFPLTRSLTLIQRELSSGLEAPGR
jgi:hypothetical protein